MKPIGIVDALFALCAALVAIFIAWLTKVNICGENCHDALYEVQLAIAVGGLVPAIALVFATSTGRRQLAVIALVAGVITYGTWGVLNDAAVHGWNNLG